MHLLIFFILFQVEYHLKWRGYPLHQSTWEPVANLDCAELIEAYEKNLGNVKGVNLNTMKTRLVNAPPSLVYVIPSRNHSLETISKGIGSEENSKAFNSEEKFSNFNNYHAWINFFN